MSDFEQPRSLFTPEQLEMIRANAVFDNLGSNTSIVEMLRAYKPRGWSFKFVHPKKMRKRKLTNQRDIIVKQPT